MLKGDFFLNNLENNVENKNLKDIKVDNNQNEEIDMPGYLDSFLQYSKKTVFIIGNNDKNMNSITKKRIIKKKKIKMENNIKYHKTENEEKNENEKEIRMQKTLKNNTKNIIKNDNNYRYNESKETGEEKSRQEIIKKLDNLTYDNNETKKVKNNKNNYKNKTNLKQQLEKYESEQKLIICQKYNYFYRILFVHKMKQILKSVFLFVKMTKCLHLSARKIQKLYHFNFYRNKFKLNYIISKILKIREQKAQKITSIIKTYFIRKEAKALLQKADNNYIIYSSISIEKNDKLYFKYIHKNGKGENFYFEYSPLLNCFIYLLDKNNDKYLKIIEGNFYNSKLQKFIDKSYEINNKGENVINLPKIIQKANIISERNDRIINRYMKLHQPIKRITIDEYEESKRKSKDDYNLKNKSSKSQKLTKLKETSRSISFMKIKSEKTKSILKPSRSYINLKCEEKKIQFGKAKIRKYKNIKD